MDVNRAQENIAITLLSYSSMQHACISSVCTIILICEKDAQCVEQVTLV